MTTPDGPLPSATRRLLRFPWGQLSCLCWEPAAHDPASNVLLLHGGGLDSASLSWGQTGPALAAAGYRVVAPDLPGFGSSPAAPWGYTQELLVELVGEIIAALSWETPVVGGLSMGGGMALGYGLGRGDVRGLMLLGCYGLMDRQVEGPLSPAVHLLTWGLLRTGALDAVTRRYLNSRRLMASSLNGLIRNPAQRTDALLDEVLAAGRLGTNLTAFGQWQRDQFGPTKARTNYTAALPGLHVPVLIIHGSRDSGVPVARARAAAHLLPDAHLVVVDNAGHWVQRDRPDLVIPAMLAFLADLPHH